MCITYYKYALLLCVNFYLLNITLNIQQTNEILQFIFLRQGQNGLFTLDLTQSSGKNEWKAIEGMKVRFRAIQVS